MRVRLSDPEIKFLIQVLRETEESINFAIDFDEQAKSLDRNIVEYRRKAIVVKGMIRKFESLLNGGKKRLNQEAHILCRALT